MSAVVVDASVIVKQLLAEPGALYARAVVALAEPALAPDLIFAECASALWRRIRRDPDRASVASEALGLLRGIPLEMISLSSLTPRALELALRFDHPVYDCYYLAAAMQRDCALATADRRLWEFAQELGFGSRAILVT